MPKTKTYDWRDPKAITAAALSVLAVDLVWDIAGLFLKLLWGPRTAYEGIPPAEWAVAQLLVGVHDVFGLVVLLGVVVLIFWILRASKNAHVLKGRSLRSSPLFAALWWYVIPFMSLFKPVEAMGEIWDASAPDVRRREQYRFVLWAWWGATILASALSYLVDIFRHEGFVVVLQSVAGIVQCAAFAYIVKRISDMQAEKRTISVFSDTEPLVGVLERITG